MSGMPKKEEQGRRVTFEQPLAAHMMAIDGTWRRSCNVREISDSGAVLQVDSSIEGISLNEFFLSLSSRGLAYRRCRLDGVNGERLEVSFLRQRDKKSRAKEP